MNEQKINNTFTNFFIFWDYKYNLNSEKDFIMKSLDIIDKKNLDLKNKVNSLKSMGADEEDIAEILDGYSSSLSEFSDNFYNLLPISLYSWSEKYLKKIFFVIFKENSKEFKLRKIMYEYKRHRIYLKNLTDFKIFNELRLVNNCIKHNGVVDAKLSKINSKWEKGKEINISKKQIIDYLNGCIKFFNALMTMINEKFIENPKNIILVETV